MQTRRSLPEVALTAIVATIALDALALQLILLLHGEWHGKGPWLATIRFFSYFTIVANLLVALVCTFSLVRSTGRLQTFFSSARVRGAAALYIGVTGSIYFAVLSALWTPTGFQWLADVSLHYAVPLMYLALWIGFEPRRTLAWSDLVRWLIFPLVYLVWTLARGAWLHEYPYPFIDVDAIGMPRVLQNALAVTAFLVVLGAVLIGFNRGFARTSRDATSA
jgi:hypothetical protein